MYRLGQRTFGYIRADATHFDGDQFENCEFRHFAADRAVFDAALFTASVFMRGVFRSSHINPAAIFLQCTFSNSEFDASDIVAATFTSCRFQQCTFAGAHIYAAKFVDCEFSGCAFSDAHLERTTFERCRTSVTSIDRAIFIASNLDPFAIPQMPMLSDTRPVIDWQSISRSLRKPDLDLLLLATGMPDILVYYLIDAARAVDQDMLYKLMRSTFISYGKPDREFAVQLRDALERNGVRTFLFEKDAVPGQRIHRVMRGNVNKYDRIILICSEAALKRHGVRNEIEETFAREARDGGASYLIPIARDAYVFESQDPLAIRIRERVVADFQNSTADSSTFHGVLQSLLRALSQSDEP
jgi:hypothetical protein